MAQASATRRIPLRWKAVTIVFIVCGLGSLLAWGVLLTSFCSNPQVPVLREQRDNAYNCHGATVYISPLESELRHWLIPIGGCFIVFGLLAAVRGVITAGHVRIDVSVNVTDTSK
jgi:hypothetical protein